MYKNMRCHSPRAAGSIAIEGKLLLNLFYSSLQSNTHMSDLQTLYNYGKDTTR